MLLTVTLLAVLSSVCAQGPKFQNAQRYTEVALGDIGNTTDSEFPHGFKRAVVKHPQNVPGNENLVVYLDNLEDKYMEIRVETEDDGAGMNARDDDAGPEMSILGQGVTCYAPSKGTLKIEFYCAESCQSSDTYFYYRIKVSPEGADDQWCANQADDFPSDLREVPDVIPSLPATPPPPTEPPISGSITILPYVVVTIFGIVATFYLQ